jgi:alpha-glucosidase (family GH31 glycosyl hydrolase)
VAFSAYLPVAAITALEIFPGADGEFTLYEDDGISEDYLKNKATWIRIGWNDAEKTLTLSPGHPGSTPIHQRFRVRLMTASGQTTILYTGKPIALQL